MSQYTTTTTTITLARVADAVPVPFHGPLPLRSIDVVEVDDDEIIDGWLASLTPGELEDFLSFLAATPADAGSALDPTG